jgi:hypothetical protein
MPIDQTVTAKYYSEVILKTLREKLKQMLPRLAQKIALLFHDNAPSYTAAATVNVINSYKWQLLSHPPYSPDHALCDFYLFPELKTLLAGKKYKTRADLISAVTQYLKHKSTSWFTARIQKLPRRWQKCVDVHEGGECFEKE